MGFDSARSSLDAQPRGDSILRWIHERSEWDHLAEEERNSSRPINSFGTVSTALFTRSSMRHPIQTAQSSCSTAHRPLSTTMYTLTLILRLLCRACVIDVCRFPREQLCPRRSIPRNHTARRTLLLPSARFQTSPSMTVTRSRKVAEEHSAVELTARTTPVEPIPNGSTNQPAASSSPSLKYQAIDLTITVAGIYVCYIYYAVLQVSDTQSTVSLLN
jgi:hypothetical protein